MMQQKSKKILIYLFLFLMIGSLNNKNFKNIDFKKINKISIKGLDEKNNLKLENDLRFLELGNLFFLKKKDIEEIIDRNNLVENYLVFKKYPSTLEITIHKTDFLAKIKRDNNDFILGSNGKLIKMIDKEIKLPFIFGDLNVKKFFELKKAIDLTDFDYHSIKNFFFFKSGRWDIETKDGLLIKLPNENLKNSLELFLIFLTKNNHKEIKKIDLRQHNQIIINE